MPRYFVDKNNITETEILVTGEDVKHIATVLRGRIGDKLEVCDGDGFDYSCVITDIDKSQIKLQPLDKTPSGSEPRTKVTLFQGLPKSDKMELIIQKCVELGIDKIVPVATEHAVVKLDKKDGAKKVERWQKIALSAAKQSGRGKIPEIGEVVSFKSALEMCQGQAIIAYENEKDNDLKKALENFKSEKISFFIGPEGGFSQEEVSQAISKGVKPITLGQRILRTETAAMALTAILLYELG